MKILLSAYACRPNAGTEPGYGWNWATHLAARGLEVYVLTAERYRKDIEPELRANPVPNLKFCYVRAPWGMDKRSEIPQYVAWQFEALKSARELARSVSFDLVHHVTYGSVHVPSPLWRLGIPVVFGPVGGGQTAPSQMLSYFGAGKRKEQLRTAYTRLLSSSSFYKRGLRRMNFVLAANRDTLELVQNAGCKHADLICDAGLPGNVFATAPRQFQESDCPLKLLWVGRILPRKALPLALDALARVQQATLTIVGDGLDANAVRQMISDRNLESRVHWEGKRLPWNEVQTAYREHDAMLFTSLRDSFGSQLMEAMAQGLPIITLNLHGARDFVPQTAGLKVPVSEPEETVQNLARAIEAFASFSPEKRNEMSAAAWNFARSFTWTARAEFAEGIYKNLLAAAIPVVKNPLSQVSPLQPIQQ